MIHKTPYFIQNALRVYIEGNKTLDCKVVAGLAFEELTLPVIVVYAMESNELTGGLGKMGNRRTTVSIVLQTTLATSEEEHWDRWAEIEDMFSIQRATLVANLNAETTDITFQDMEEQIGMINQAQDAVRITEKRLTFLTRL